MVLPVLWVVNYKSFNASNRKKSFVEALHPTRWWHCCVELAQVHRSWSILARTSEIIWTKTRLLRKARTHRIRIMLLHADGQHPYLTCVMTTVWVTSNEAVVVIIAVPRSASQMRSSEFFRGKQMLPGYIPVGLDRNSACLKINNGQEQQKLSGTRWLSVTAPHWAPGLKAPVLPCEGEWQGGFEASVRTSQGQKAGSCGRRREGRGERTCGAERRSVAGAYGQSCVGVRGHWADGTGCWGLLEGQASRSDDTDLRKLY